METIPKTLTIAGSDSGGGAGIQADLKTFSALQSYGMSAITALTAQNTQGVNNISGVEPSFIKDQLEAVFEDIGADAVKIGMLHAPEVIETVVNALNKYQPQWVVLDPVMVAKSGDRLLQENAIDALTQKLMPLANIITPNIPEAEVLCNRQIPNVTAMEESVAGLTDLGPEAVLIKGGHLAQESSPDLLYIREGAQKIWIDRESVETPNTHGTGCTLSSAITAYLARGLSIEEAVQKAKVYMTESLKAGKDLSIGQGKGPVHHFYNWWQ